MKTNAARLLDAMGVTYDLREYEVDPSDLSAETVAGKVGLPLEQVFKTLVVRGDRFTWTRRSNCSTSSRSLPGSGGCRF